MCYVHQLVAHNFTQYFLIPSDASSATAQPLFMCLHLATWDLLKGCSPLFLKKQPLLISVYH